MTEAPASDVCIPNIGPNERRRRLYGGLMALALAVAIGAALIAGGAGRWWRLVLFPLYYAAMSGVFQWREKT